MHPAGNSGFVLLSGFLAQSVSHAGSCLVIGKRTTTSKHTQFQLCVLDWTVTRLEWLCQLCYVNYLCVEKHQNFGPEIVWKSRGLFRALGYNELITYR